MHVEISNNMDEVKITCVKSYRFQLSYNEALWSSSETRLIINGLWVPTNFFFKSQYPISYGSVIKHVLQPGNNLAAIIDEVLVDTLSFTFSKQSLYLTCLFIPRTLKNVIEIEN